MATFKAIIVGGGPVGLTAAHALNKAGIDFLLLESRSHIVVDAGSNLVISPVGIRTWAQLGLFDALNAVSSPLGRVDRMDHNGRDIGSSQVFNILQENFGAAPRVISRHDLTRTLYEALPAASLSKMLPNKKFSSMEITNNGVIVSCADGSSYHGSIVIGADGAHSMVRKLMRTLALEAGSSAVNEEQPYLTTYRSLWIRFPRPHDLVVGTSCEAHGRDLATQLFAGEETGVIGVYERIETPTKERQRYTAADQDALIKKWGHVSVVSNGGQTLREVYDSRSESGLVSLEEGVVQHWSYGGRVALVGDAAHKFTPSTGAGCMNGLLDIVALVNKLQTIVQPHSTAPDTTTIATAFKAYQTQREASAHAANKQSGQVTAMATWQNGGIKFIDRHVLSYHAVQKRLFSLGAKTTAMTPSFGFADEVEQFAGRVPWVRVV